MNRSVCLRIVASCAFCAFCAFLERLIRDRFRIAAERDRITVSGGAASSFGVASSCRYVDALALGEDFDVSPLVAFTWADVAREELSEYTYTELRTLVCAVLRAGSSRGASAP